MVDSDSLGSLKVLHLFFVDDSLIISEPNQDHFRSLRALFLCFETVSSLRVNLSSKFELVLVGPVTNTMDLADILGCKI